MTFQRIIEMALKPPFKYFIVKEGYFGAVRDELCFNSLSKAKETAEKFGLLDNSNLMIVPQTKIKKKCLCCGNEMELFVYEERDFCDKCFPIVCREVFNKANDGMTVEEVKERIRRNIEE